MKAKVLKKISLIVIFAGLFLFIGTKQVMSACPGNCKATCSSSETHYPDGDAACLTANPVLNKCCITQPTPTPDTPCPGTCRSNCSSSETHYPDGDPYCQTNNPTTNTCCIIQPTPTPDTPCPGTCRSNCSSSETHYPDGDPYCQTNNPTTNTCCTQTSATTTPKNTSTPAPNGKGGVNPFCNGEDGINTAIGCIPITDGNAFVEWLFPRLLGVMGGIAFLLMLYGGFLIITAGGNQEKIKAGQETITSAVAGLIFAIFSLFLLQLIGVDILQIPGLQR